MLWHRPSLSEPIRRQLERTGLLALLLGYGVLLLGNVQLFKHQRNQRQLRMIQRAERLLLRNLSVSGQPPQLERLFSNFSNSDFVLWGHSAGQNSSLLMPQNVSSSVIPASANLRRQAEQVVGNQSRPQLFHSRGGSYMITSRSLNLPDNLLRLYLLENVSEELAFQHRLHGLLLLVAVFASLMSVLLNRRGVDHALLPLKGFGDLVSLIRLNPQQQQLIEPKQLPQELQPLGLAVIDLCEQLADSVKRQQQFASSVSHELSNPITLIGGYTRRLMRPAANFTDDQRQQLLVIEEESRRLGQLVSDLVAINRAEIGSQSLKMQLLCIGDLFQDAISLVEGSTQKSRVLLSPEALDPPSIEVFADRASVLQCVVHLIDNACKYSPKTAPVEIGFSLQPEMLFLWVRDHGPGIPADERETMFERFRRGQNSSGIPGSGIGLTLVQMLVDQMHGSLRIDDAEGGGALLVMGLRRCQFLGSDLPHR